MMKYYDSASLLIFAGRMLFLAPNQQRARCDNRYDIKTVRHMRAKATPPPAVIATENHCC